MQHAPITTPITDKLASMPWIRWFRQLVDRVDEIKGTADAPAWDSITGKPDEFPPEPHTHSQYLTEETDPTVPAHVKGITGADIARWDEADQFVAAGGCQLSGATEVALGDLALVSETIYPETGIAHPFVTSPDVYAPFAIIGGVPYFVKSGGIYSRSESGVFTYWKGSGITGNVFVKMTDDLVIEFGGSGAPQYLHEIRLGTFSRTQRGVFSVDGFTMLPVCGMRLNDAEIICAGQDFFGNRAKPYVINTSTWAVAYLSAAPSISGNPKSIVSNEKIHISTQFGGIYVLNNDYTQDEYIEPDWYSSTYTSHGAFAQGDRVFFPFSGGNSSPYLGWWWRDVVSGDIGYYPESEFPASGGGTTIVDGSGGGFYGAGTTYYSFDPPAEIIYSISVPAFRARIFDDAAFLTLAEEFDIPAQEIPVPGYDQRYYLCAQRSGDTVTLVSVPQADVYTINMSNIVPLWRFEIHGTELHQIHYDNMGDGLPNKQEFAQLRTEPYRLAVEGGFAVTLGSGRSLSMTGAEVFFGHHRVSVLAFDSATDTVHDFFHVAGVWDDTETVGGWAWDNLNYDNGTALTALGNNKWGAIFVYRSIGDSKEIFVVRGQTEASHIEEARLIGIPPTPDMIQWHTMLVGRILFQKSATTGTWEPYSTASFLRSLSPQISLDDLTDVTVGGAAEASVLQKNLAGEWVADLLPWDDMRHIAAAKTTGANRPSYAAFGTSMYGWRFAAGDLLSCDSEQMPHSWAGTPIRPHVHFGSENGGTGNIVWEVIIATRPAKTGAWSAEQTITKTWTGTLSALGVDALDLWDSPGVTLVDTGASTLMKMRIRMVSKTFTGNVFLDGFDSHIQHKRIGTINEFGPL